MPVFDCDTDRIEELAQLIEDKWAAARAAGETYTGEGTLYGEYRAMSAELQALTWPPMPKDVLGKRIVYALHRRYRSWCHVVGDYHAHGAAHFLTISNIGIKSLARLAQLIDEHPVRDSNTPMVVHDPLYRYMSAFDSLEDE